MRKSLFLIGGIAKKDKLYVEQDLYNHCELLNLCQYKFSLIEEINTNKHRDGLSWRKLFDFMLGSKLSDPVKLRLSCGLRGDIKKEIENTLLKAKDTQKTIIAHSQGTIETLISEFYADMIVLCGSPLGFCTPYGRWSMQNTVHRFPWSKPKAKCRRLVYLYSSKDPVSMFPPSIKDLSKYVEFQEVVYLDTNLSHDFSDFLKVIYEQNLLLG